MPDQGLPPAARFHHGADFTRAFDRGHTLSLKARNVEFEIRETYESALAFGRATLIGLGLERGHHFGVWSTNRPEWVVLQFAAARVGVVLVTINPSYRASEAAYALARPR